MSGFFVYPMLFVLTLAWTMCSELERGFKGYLPKNAGVRIPYGLFETTQLYEWFFCLSNAFRIDSGVDNVQRTGAWIQRLFA
jgi:hypothetical protein